MTIDYLRKVRYSQQTFDGRYYGFIHVPLSTAFWNNRIPII